ncbi:hypothetical protein, variant [Aphanomyces invadans]|uniref:Uncharacterized protein n=1 Tax=Aphanomyces invadans TaxID=157072 RepID=A0A024TDM3_9STRA|nr:hypothetical protein, variant [Aphanomyces invadans]ETV91397.1 hypothetical protein, variant [Aphanomyces invadans]|eukprot:XP_008880025.1 hypothetical protein, variant [Aphanomyces invadans]
MPIAAPAADDAWRRKDESGSERPDLARKSSDGSASEETSDDTIALPRLRSNPMTSSHTSYRLPPLTDLTHHPSLSRPAAPTSPFVGKIKSRKRKMSMQDVMSSNSPPSLHRHAPPPLDQLELVPSTSLLLSTTTPPTHSLTPATPSTSLHPQRTKGRSKRCGRQPHAAAAPPPPRTASSIARLTTGKDVCVVAHQGIVDWVATYYVYGFDKNSLFHLMLPLRPQQEPWSDAEVAYLTILAKLLQQGKMRLPRGKSMEAYVAEKLHAPEPRIRFRLQQLEFNGNAQGPEGDTQQQKPHRPAAKNVMSPAEVAELKEVREAASGT